MKPIRIIGGALLATFTAFAVMTTPLPASAGQKAPGHKSLGHKSPGQKFVGQKFSGQKFCPPGLVDKNCMPPGQLKKWTKGRALPQDVYFRPLSNWDDYDLSPPPYGHVYGSVDGDILLMRTATRLIVEAVILAAFAN